MGLDLEVKIKNVTFKNPVMPAAGTFGSGKEYAQLLDINSLGAVVVKGVAINPWSGNAPPRIAEVKGGILNSIGLQNNGVDYFIKEELPFLRQFDTKIIVNVCGRTVGEYCEVVERLSDENIDMIELNISCPNVNKGGITFGTERRSVESVVKLVKSKSKQPVIVKLSPNVTDIVEIARVAESSGADCISLINTLLAMKIDIKTRRPVLANKMGGLSGSAVMSVAVRMVYQTSRAVKIPIIGMGGISSGEDAIEFILAGASAVAVGTASFSNPKACLTILDGIKKYMIDNNLEKLSDIKMDCSDI